jgi:hypothetical protein
MQHVTKNLPPQLFHDDASGLRNLEERERQRVLAIIDTAVTIAAGFVLGMLAMGILVTL